MAHRVRAIELGIFLLALSACVTVSGRQSSWPQIRADEAKRTFVDPGANDMDTPFVFLIHDTSGQTVYKLECHNGNNDEELGFNFSGDFHCALFAIKNGVRASWTLLAEETKAQRSSDWFNRGRMLAQQLRGPCAPSPWGTVRVFELRGMRLSLRFTDLEWASGDQPQLNRFTFIVQAIPDRHATSATAQRVPMPKRLLDVCLEGRR